MELIEKDKLIEALDKLIKARNCECSRQKLIEKQAFEYCKTLVNKMPTYEADQDIR